MTAWMILLLIVQTALAVAGGRALVRGVAPGAGGGQGRPGPCLAADVWGPLAVVGPMLFLTARVGRSVGGVGWVPLGGPACAGLAAVAVSFFAPRPSGTGAGVGISGMGPRLVVALASAGLILALLGGADELSVWTGQTTFAVAAVFLWLNTPASAGPGRGSGTAPGSGRSMALAVLCAAGQGGLASLTAGRWTAASAAIMVAYAAVSSSSIAWTADPGWSRRVAGWSAAVGTLFGIGLLSLAHLMPQTWGLLRGRPVEVTVAVAHGFGRYRVEGTVLLLLPAAAIALAGMERVARALIGALLGTLALAIIAWRIARW